MAPGDAPEDLVIGRVHQVPAFRRVHPAQGVGSGADSLRLQGFQGEVIAHFIGDHPQQIILHPDLQHRLELPAGNRQGKIPRIQPVPWRDAHPVGCFRLLPGPPQRQLRAAVQGRVLVEQDQPVLPHLDSDFAAAGQQHAAVLSPGRRIGPCQRQVNAICQIQAPQQHPHRRRGRFRPRGGKRQQAAQQQEAKDALFQTDSSFQDGTAARGGLPVPFKKAAVSHSCPKFLTVWK